MSSSSTSWWPLHPPKNLSHNRTPYLPQQSLSWELQPQHYTFCASSKPLMRMVRRYVTRAKLGFSARLLARSQRGYIAHLYPIIWATGFEYLEGGQHDLRTKIPEISEVPWVGPSSQGADTSVLSRRIARKGIGQCLISIYLAWHPRSIVRKGVIYM